jgi:hypothetical protein
MDDRKAQFCLRSAESGIDRVNGQSILKVRQFYSCTRTRSRRPRTPRYQHTASNPSPDIPPTADPAPLATSQLSWTQQCVPHNNPRCPGTISTRANCKINALWLQQWQSSAKRPPNPDLVEATLGTNFLKLHERLRKAVSLLSIQLRTETIGCDFFILWAIVPSVPSPLCSCDRGQQTAKHVIVNSTQCTLIFWSASCGLLAYSLLMFCSEFIIVTFIICYVPAICLLSLVHMLRVVRTLSLNVICPHFYPMLLLSRPWLLSSPFLPDGSGAAPPF